MLYQQLGRNIRSKRIRKQLTQEKLAEQAQISLSFLGHIERGTRKLSVDTLWRIAIALECSVDELLGVNVDFEKKRQFAREILNHALGLLEEEPE